MGRYARTLSAVVVALVATLVAAAAPALAIDVKVRVEINQADVFHGYVDRTLVSLPIGGPGVATSDGFMCPSNSPIGALQAALGTQPWAGKSTDATTATVTKIKTTSSNPAAPLLKDVSTWQLYVGTHPESNACRQLGPDEANTEILFYLKCGPSTSVSVPCFRGDPVVIVPNGGDAWPVTPVIAGVSASVTVYVNGKPSTTASLKTDEGGTPVRTDQVAKDGTARVPFTAKGPHTLVATDALDGATVHVPDRIPVCVTDSADGFCGTTKADQNPFVEPPSPCETNGADGLCGTIDTTGPMVQVTNIAGNQVFKPKKGPTGVKGITNVARDPNGIRDVRLRLTRLVTQKVKVKAKKKSKKARKASVAKKAKKVRYRTRKVCTYWNDATLLLEAAKRCGAAGGKWFTADLSDLRDTFSYDFALRLPKGTYLLEVRTADENGSLDPPAPGRNVLRFVVK